MLKLYSETGDRKGSPLIQKGTKTRLADVNDNVKPPVLKMMFKSVTESSAFLTKIGQDLKNLSAKIALNPDIEATETVSGTMNNVMNIPPKPGVALNPDIKSAAPETVSGTMNKLMNIPSKTGVSLNLDIKSEATETISGAMNKVMNIPPKVGSYIEESQSVTDIVQENEGMTEQDDNEHKIAM